MPVTRWTPDAFRKAGFGRRYVWIDLVNSEYYDGLGGSTDYLEDESWLRVFLDSAALPQVEHSRFAPAATRALREKLRIAAERIAAEGRVPGGLLTVLNKALSAGVTRSIERSQTGYRVALRPTRLNWRWAESQIAASFGAFLESGEIQRLKVCPNPACRWVFYDETKGNTRRWCNDRRCGNRDKVRRYREKQRR